MLVRIIAFLTALALTATLAGQRHGQTYKLFSNAGSGVYAIGVQNNQNVNGARLELADSRNVTNQQFTLESAGDGYFFLHNGLGRHVHVEGISNQPKAMAVLWSGRGQTGANNTKWKFHRQSNGSFLIQSKMGTWLDVQWGKAAPGTPIWMWTKNGQVAQQWRLSLIKKDPDAGRATTLRTNNIGELCPNTREGHLKGGDREFGGPVEYKLTMNLEVKNGKSLEANFRLQLTERDARRRNRTRVDASWTRTICTAPRGKFIHNFTNQGEKFSGYFNETVSGYLPEGDAEFIGCNDGTAYDIKFPRLGIVVKLIADTGSDDVSDDSNCSCDSKVVRIDMKGMTCEVRDYTEKWVLIRNALFPDLYLVPGTLDVQLRKVEGGKEIDHCQPGSYSWIMRTYGDGKVTFRNVQTKRMLVLSKNNTKNLGLSSWQPGGPSRYETFRLHPIINIATGQLVRPPYIFQIVGTDRLAMTAVSYTLIPGVVQHTAKTSAQLPPDFMVLPGLQTFAQSWAIENLTCI